MRIQRMFQTDGVATTEYADDINRAYEMQRRMHPSAVCIPNRLSYGSETRPMRVRGYADREQQRAVPNSRFSF